MRKCIILLFLLHFCDIYGQYESDEGYIIFISTNFSSELYQISQETTVEDINERIIYKENGLIDYIFLDNKYQPKCVNHKITYRDIISQQDKISRIEYCGDDANEIYKELNSSSYCFMVGSVDIINDFIMLNNNELDFICEDVLLKSDENEQRIYLDIKVNRYASANKHHLYLFQDSIKHSKIVEYRIENGISSINSPGEYRISIPYSSFKDFYIKNKPFCFQFRYIDLEEYIIKMDINGKPSNNLTIFSPAEGVTINDGWEGNDYSQHYFKIIPRNNNNLVLTVLENSTANPATKSYTLKYSDITPQQPYFKIDSKTIGADGGTMTFETGKSYKFQFEDEDVYAKYKSYNDAQSDVSKKISVCVAETIVTVPQPKPFGATVLFNYVDGIHHIYEPGGTKSLRFNITNCRTASATLRYTFNGETIVGNTGNLKKNGDYSSGSITQSFKAGTYTFSIVDQYGKSITVYNSNGGSEFIIKEPLPITFKEWHNNPICSSECISLKDGTIYVENIQNGLVSNSINFEKRIFINDIEVKSNAQAGTRYSFQVPPGNYTVKVCDVSNGYIKYNVAIKDVYIAPGTYTPQIDDNYITTIPPDLFCLSNGKVVINSIMKNYFSYGINVQSIVQNDTIFGFNNNQEQDIYVRNNSVGCIAPQKVKFTPRPMHSVTTVKSVAPVCSGQSNGYSEIKVNKLGNRVEFSDPFNHAQVLTDSTYKLSGASGRYTIKVYDVISDNMKCSTEHVIRISTKSDLYLYYLITNDAINKGSAGGAASFTLAGGNSGMFNIKLYNGQLNTGELYKEINQIDTRVNITGLYGKAYNVGGGIYSVFVTDTLGCEYSFNNAIKIYEPDKALELTCTATNPLCNNDSNGSILLTTTGGWDTNAYGSYKYKYSADTVFPATGSNTTVYNSMSSGTYRFVVIDGRGGTDTSVVTLTNPLPVLATPVYIQNVLCHGNNTGYIKYKVSGGNAPYTFYNEINNTQLDKFENYNRTYSFVDSMLTAGGLYAGNHYFKVADTNNCISPLLTQNISQPQRLKLNYKIAHTICNEPNGVLYANATGGTAPYTQLWNSLSNSNITTAIQNRLTDTVLINNCNTGSYKLVVTDGNNCKDSTGVLTINPSKKPVIEQPNVIYSHVLCHGDTNGSIKVLATRGDAPVKEYYIKQANSDQAAISNTAGSFTSLSAGNYSVYASDTLGCVSVKYLVTVTEPLEPLVSVVENISPVIAKGESSGTITISTQGGNAGAKTLKLSNTQNTSLSSVTFGNSNRCAVNALYAGNYSVTVTDSKLCSDTIKSIIVEEPDSALGFTITNKTDALCKAKTGAFTVSGYGGWGNYRYRVDSITGSVNIFDNMYAGSYVVTIFDKLGAKHTENVKINGPYSELEMKVTDSVLPGCGSNGAITVDVWGGTPQYQILFANQSKTVPTRQEVSYTNLEEGIYSIQAIDSNGCVYNLQTNLSSSEKLSITAFNYSLPATNNSPTASIQAYVNGGVEPIVYKWYNSNNTLLPYNTGIVNNILPGYYRLTVSDNGGCTSSDFVYIPNTNDYELTLVKLENETKYRGNNGYVVLSSLLHTVETVELINSIGQSVTYLTSGSQPGFSNVNDTITIKNIAPGKYLVKAKTNGNHILYTRFTINEYQLFEINKTQITDVKQKGSSSGAISINIAGGAGNNTVKWQSITHPGIILNVVTDINSSSVKDIPAGIYTVTITDKYNNTIEQTIEVHEPDTPLQIAVLGKQNNTCYEYNNGWAVFGAIGGWGNYQFSNNRYSNYTNSGIFRNLSAGNNYYYIIDKGGVVDSLQMLITEPEKLKANISNVDSVKCFGNSNGAVYFSVDGGTKPYKAANTADSVWQTNLVFGNLQAEQYSYAFTDSNNCEANIITVAIPQPDSLYIADTIIKHTTCGLNNGIVTVNLHGGTLPYVYNWVDNEFTTISNEASAVELAMNRLYSLTATDRNNCTTRMTVFIKESASALIDSIATANTLCSYDTSGKARIISVTPSVPYAPYTTAWSNGDTATVSYFPKGTHYITLTDSNNCITQKYFTINSPQAITLLLDKRTDAQCFGYNNGALSVISKGGNGVYKYKWSNSDTTNTATNLYAGNYTVTVTDSNNCSEFKTYSVSQPDELQVNAGNDITICPGSNYVFDGKEFAQHQWILNNNEISTSRYLSAQEQGIYYLKVTNSNGCNAYDTVVLNIDGNFLQTNFLMSTEACINDTLFVIELSNLQLDSMVWEYNRVFEDITPKGEPEYFLTLQPKDTGYYTITMKGYSGGCVDEVSKQVFIKMLTDSVYNTQLGYDPLIVDFIIAPNPNNGIFSTNITLREVADVELKVHSISNGNIIDTKQFAGHNNYKVTYNLENLPSGMYILTLFAGNEKRQARIIISEN